MQRKFCSSNDSDFWKAKKISNSIHQCWFKRIVRTQSQYYHQQSAIHRFCRILIWCWRQALNFVFIKGQNTLWSSAYISSRHRIKTIRSKEVSIYSAFSIHSTLDFVWIFFIEIFQNEVCFSFFQLKFLFQIGSSKCMFKISNEISFSTSIETNEYIELKTLRCSFKRIFSCNTTKTDRVNF